MTKEQYDKAMNDLYKEMLKEFPKIASNKFYITIIVVSLIVIFKCSNLI